MANVPATIRIDESLGNLVPMTYRLSASTVPAAAGKDSRGDQNRQELITGTFKPSRAEVPRVRSRWHRAPIDAPGSGASVPVSGAGRSGRARGEDVGDSDPWWTAGVVPIRDRRHGNGRQVLLQPADGVVRSGLPFGLAAVATAACGAPANDGAPPAGTSAPVRLQFSYYADPEQMKLFKDVGALLPKEEPRSRWRR